MFRICQLALFVTISAAGLAGTAARAQNLPVTRCDPNANTCDRSATASSSAASPQSRMPALGAAGRATVVSPSLRSTELAVDAADAPVPVPGCEKLATGVMRCQSVLDFEHCRTLMISGMVPSCQIDNAFSGGTIEPREAAPGDYDLEVKSNAKVRVNRGDRGHGQIKGEASAVLSFRPPVELKGQAWCIQRDRYLYHPTGPEGGDAEIDHPGECDEPLEFSFQAHEDDLLRAYDICETFGAWGDEIEDSIEILAASLYQIRSREPAFSARHPSGTAIIAPYAMVEAPLAIDCRE